MNSGHDRTNEANIVELKEAMSKNGNGELVFSSDKAALSNYNVYIVTVPTPIDQFKAPDLTPLIRASEMIGKELKKGDIVIYESTVYPGCTEKIVFLF